MVKDFNYNQKESRKNSDPFAIQSGRYRDARISKFYRSPWSEDAFITDRGEKEVIGKSFESNKLKVAVFFLCCFIFLLLGKSAWLQIVKKDYYYSASEGNRIRVLRIEPKRGVIYDRFGNPLVHNRANFMLYFVPIDLPADLSEREEIYQELTLILPDLDPEKMEDLHNSVRKYSLEAYQPIFVIDNIPYEQAIKLYLLSENWPGVVLSSRTNRDYLVYGRENENEDSEYYFSMSHVIGYTGKISPAELERFGKEYLPIDYIGKMGIEYFWENELKGQSGQKRIEVDALGKEKKIISISEPEDGNNLVLSLDIVMQSKLEEILLAHLKKLESNRAVAIVMDPGNGEILSMVNIPAYDNNSFARGISRVEYESLITHPDKPLFNRAVSGEYPSGSTIKPVMVAAALEEGVINERTTFLSTGGIRIGQWFFPDWLAGGHGRTDARKAIAQSVNTFFYYIGGGHDDFSGLGVDRIVEYERLFGMGEQLGIDLAGESGGFLPSREWKEEVKGERWYIGDTYHLSIGQGHLLVTPLQVAAFTAVFANGGSLYRPHFVKQILSSDDRELKNAEDLLIRKDFISPRNIEIVRQGMRETVVSGSARSMQSVPVAVAGKTGTAQWSSTRKTHAWFNGFAPYDNPELVITILVEEGGEGSSTAVPIAREFLEWYFGEYRQ